MKRIISLLLAIAVLGIAGADAQGVLKSPSQKNKVKTAISNKSILKRGVSKKKTTTNRNNGSTTSGNSSQYNANLDLIRTDVAVSNSTCPQQISEGLTMTSIKFNESRRAVIFNYTVDLPMVTAADMRTSLNDYASNMETLKDMAAEEDMQVLLEALIEEKGCIELNFYMKRENKTVSSTYTTFDLSSALKYVQSPSYNNNTNTSTSATGSNSQYADVDAIINATNINMPMNVDSTTVLESLSRDGSIMFYNYTLTEDGFTAEQIAPFKGGIRQSIENNFDNALTQQLLQTLIDANITLIHRYVGSKTGGSFDIVFSPSDLRALKK
ncbi:MAG: hypothetical protein J6C81_02460 [Muribaculaceae bacterium]|nr:hypothetical protein [Muribaculaceae bacterium]